MRSIGLSKSPWDRTREIRFSRLARSGFPSSGLPAAPASAPQAGEDQPDEFSRPRCPTVWSFFSDSMTRTAFFLIIPWSCIRITPGLVSFGAVISGAVGSSGGAMAAPPTVALFANGPVEHPLEGVERRPGRLSLRSSVGGHVEPLGGRRLPEKPPPAKGFLSPNRYRSAHHDGRCLVVPVAVTAGNKIESLRQWASGRCLSEDWAGVNSRQKGLRALKRPRGAGLLGIPLPSR